MKILGSGFAVWGRAGLFGVVTGEWAGERVGPDVWETCREFQPRRCGQRRGATSPGPVTSRQQELSARPFLCWVGRLTLSHP